MPWRITRRSPDGDFEHVDAALTDTAFGVNRAVMQAQRVRRRGHGLLDLLQGRRPDAMA